MGIVSFLLGLPLAPVRGVIAVGRAIQEQVDKEQHDPAAIRRSLEAADRAKAAGNVTAEDEKAIQRQAIARMAGGKAAGRVTGER